MILKTRFNGDRQYRAVFREPSLARSGVGLRVSGDGVSGIPAVLDAVRLAANEIATHKLRVWRGEPESRRVVTTTWQARLFAGQLNPDQSQHVFWETVQESIDLRGNAYVWKTGFPGSVSQLWALHPDQVAVVKTAGGPLFEVAFADGFIDPVGVGAGFTRVGRDHILHIRGFGDGGRFTAPSPIERHARTFNAALAKQIYESGFYEHGGAHSLAVTMPREVTLAQAREWRELWDATYGGAENAGKTKVLLGGADIKPIGVSQADAQYVESVQMTVEEVARVFGVPVSLLDGRAGSAPLSPEHERQRWGTYGVTPRFSRIEAALAADDSIFGGNSRDYPMFDTAGFLRGDLTAEDAIAHQQVQDGRLLVDEWRARNGLPDLPDGLGKVPQVTPVGGAPNTNGSAGGQPVNDNNGEPAAGSQ